MGGGQVSARWARREGAVRNFNGQPVFVVCREPNVLVAALPWKPPSCMDKRFIPKNSLQQQGVPILCLVSWETRGKGWQNAWLLL